MKGVCLFELPAGPSGHSAPVGAGLPSCTGPTGALAAAGTNVFAIAGVVIKELYRRKDFYVLFVLTALITLVMGSVNFFHEDRIAGYLKEITLFLIWVSSLVIAVTTTARQIPAEREQRTLLPLLAKPVTRSQLLAGKFLGCWLATGLSLVLFYLFFALVSGTREHTWPVGSYVQAALLHWAMLGVVVAMALLGSLVLAAPSSTNTLVLVVVGAMLLVGRHLNHVAVQLEEPAQTLVYALYFVLPHLEWFDVRDLIIHNWAPLPWGVWIGALLYAAVYSVLFLALACWVFRRKPVN
jgi:ABC-type transport system involved in multi-copper enzyme maturation permease subunit